MRFLTSLIVVLYATKRSSRDEFSTDVQSEGTSSYLIIGFIEVGVFE